ncbi:TPA: acyltransferase family protein [Providencia rettgeri]|nr:acyltransferase family protein [Providencia rettgeri]
MQITSRKNWVDNAKGIGILLVIAGHTLQYDISRIIYIFHMPLFFILAGVFIKGDPIKEYTIKKLTKSLYPYVFFLFCFFIYEYVFLYKGFNISQIIIWKNIKPYLYGGTELTGIKGVFWFVPVFTISVIISNIIIRNLSLKKKIIIMFIFLSLSYIDDYFFKVSLPLGITICLYAIPLVIFGNLIKNHIFYISKKYLLITVLLLFVICLSYNEIKLDMKYSIYGIPFFNFIAGAAFSVFIFSFGNKFSNKFISFFGRYSLIIMYTHQLINIEFSKKVFSNDYFQLLITILIMFLLCVSLDKMKSIRLYFSNKLTSL